MQESEIYNTDSTATEPNQSAAYLQLSSDKHLCKLSGQTWAQQSANFCDWLQQEGPHQNKGQYTARFTHSKARYRFAKVADCERYCIREYDDLHTVWLSLNARAKADTGLWYDPLDHYDGFQSGAVSKALRRCIPSDDYVGVSLHSPRQTGYTHRHVALWIDGTVAQDDFQAFINSFVRNHPTARESDNSPEKAIRVNRVTGNDLSHLPEGADSETEAQRGRTTALPREIASNLPAMQVDNDLQQAPCHVRLWASLLWATDKRAWQPLGGYGGSRLDEYASRERMDRR
ncbi:hypothetical protein [Salinarchaeum sp. Harcht-Bsk1]|uniref:hypothetical protein n=1 Tax=Salinarchaeum sp. Harcht-Bsk1 TaxID=1333523 RepID=UPI0011819899